jgi:hypothetical protein
VEVHFAVKLVILAPPLFGPSKMTNNFPEPAFQVANGALGFKGTPTVMMADFGDAAPVPTALRAAIVNWYFFPFCNPPTFTVVGFAAYDFAGCATEPRYGVTV